MSKRLEELSMDLAAGMSRRKALWRFVGGVGAAVLARKASAQGNNICVAPCRLQASWYEGKGGPPDLFGQCMAQSAHCPKGQCAYVQFNNGGRITSVCAPAGEIGG